MEAEAICYPDSILEAATTERDCSSESTLSSAAEGDSTSFSSCFDCNICLCFAAEPVVTLCGHLYCWPCIYRWLRIDHSVVGGRSRCPVCRSFFSESCLIPVYGGGIDAESDGIPGRPKEHWKLVDAVNQRRQMDSRFRGDGGGGAGRNLGFVFAGLGRSEEGVVGRRRRRRRRRRSWQELRAESFLHQLWVFLFCCAVLCFVFF